MATDPICGMFVDERTAELSLTRENRTYYFCCSGCLTEFAEPARRVAQLRLRLAVSWPLSLAVVALAYGVRFPGSEWLALGCAAVVQVYGGQGFYRGLWDAARSRLWNMDVLVAVATTVAFGYSTAVLLLPGHLPSTSYLDASALIITLILSGNYLEQLTRHRAGSAVRRLAELVPTTATVLRAGLESVVPVSELGVGDVCRVGPGSRFPTDGVVQTGRSSVDEAILTGESLPVPKAAGDPVVAGSTNLDGVLEVRATGVGSDSFLAQVGQLVAEAETSQLPLQRLADRIAQRFVPFVLAVAIAASLGWSLFGSGPTVALLVFVTVAITACPCAFGIATPAALVVAAGRGAESGVLFRGRDAIDRAARADIVLTDKTGTLTRGQARVVGAIAWGGWDDRRLLAVAAGLERGVRHPLAQAVEGEVRRRGLPPEEVSEVTVVAGRGVEGWLGTSRVELRGGPPFPDLESVPESMRASAARWSSEGVSLSALVVDGSPRGLIAFSDPVAPGVRAAVATLRAEGVRVVMVTGDNARAADAVARAAGIEEVHAGVTPEGKLEWVRRFQREGRLVAFVGDGINDAPALAAADVGLAVGTGTEVARDAGQVLLVRAGFADVALALRLARATVRKVRQNIVWALGYNAVLLPLAAGALVPWRGFSVYATLPIVGALAMAISSTLVVTNSLSLRWVALERGPRAGPAAGAGARPSPG
ncbi:MAG: heavy metal translocating P-type ATPase [Thermoplasmata archaeon]|nr:heavy metal translocating P-type ATPase [Thermoplasmata archaeon]